MIPPRSYLRRHRTDGVLFYARATTSDPTLFFHLPS